ETSVGKRLRRQVVVGQVGTTSGWVWYSGSQEPAAARWCSSSISWQRWRCQSKNRRPVPGKDWWLKCTQGGYHDRTERNAAAGTEGQRRAGARPRPDDKDGICAGAGRRVCPAAATSGTGRGRNRARGVG